MHKFNNFDVLPHSITFVEGNWAQNWKIFATACGNPSHNPKWTECEGYENAVAPADAAGVFVKFRGYPIKWITSIMELTLYAIEIAESEYKFHYESELDFEPVGYYRSSGNAVIVYLKEKERDKQCILIFRKEDTPRNGYREKIISEKFGTISIVFDKSQFVE